MLPILAILPFDTEMRRARVFRALIARFSRTRENVYEIDGIHSAENGRQTTRPARLIPCARAHNNPHTESIRTARQHQAPKIFKAVRAIASTRANEDKEDSLLPLNAVGAFPLEEDAEDDAPELTR